MCEYVCVYLHIYVCVCFTYVCVCACVPAKSLSPVQIFETPWTIGCQVPLSMRFFRILEWVAVSSSRDQTQIPLASALQADSLLLSYQGSPYIYIYSDSFPLQAISKYLVQFFQYGSLCYTVGNCWLSIIYIVLIVCLCSSKQQVLQLFITQQLELSNKHDQDT